ncbi:hypothetical protein B0H16DRAFT_797665 [Mycena metata]|uniref:Uncharacterized protein n=1 Tax=Mycena metata TaxID=1033252 RepID=A0AAD7GP22_9AGAR|nr:hypothetical protein B0H16DRAFT_797665 [Mycena metata]
MKKKPSPSCPQPPPPPKNALPSAATKKPAVKMPWKRQDSHRFRSDAEKLYTEFSFAEPETIKRFLYDSADVGEARTRIRTHVGNLQGNRRRWALSEAASRTWEPPPWVMSMVIYRLTNRSPAATRPAAASSPMAASSSHSSPPTRAPSARAPRAPSASAPRASFVLPPAQRHGQPSTRMPTPAQEAAAAAAVIPGKQKFIAMPNEWRYVKRGYRAAFGTPSPVKGVPATPSSPSEPPATRRRTNAAPPRANAVASAAKSAGKTSASSTTSKALSNASGTPKAAERTPAPARTAASLSNTSATPTVARTQAARPNPTPAAVETPSTSVLGWYVPSSVSWPSFMSISPPPFVSRHPKKRKALTPLPRSGRATQTPASSPTKRQDPDGDGMKVHEVSSSRTPRTPKASRSAKAGATSSAHRRNGRPRTPSTTPRAAIKSSGPSARSGGQHTAQRAQNHHKRRKLGNDARSSPATKGPAETSVSSSPPPAPAVPRPPPSSARSPPPLRPPPPPPSPGGASVDVGLMTSAAEVEEGPATRDQEEDGELFDSAMRSIAESAPENSAPTTSATTPATTTASATVPATATATTITPATTTATATPPRHIEMWEEEEEEEERGRSPTLPIDAAVYGDSVLMLPEDAEKLESAARGEGAAGTDAGQQGPQHSAPSAPPPPPRSPPRPRPPPSSPAPRLSPPDSSPSQHPPGTPQEPSAKALGKKKAKSPADEPAGDTDPDEESEDDDEVVARAAQNAASESFARRLQAEELLKLERTNAAASESLARQLAEEEKRHRGDGDDQRDASVVWEGLDSRARDALASMDAASAVVALELGPDELADAVAAQRRHDQQQQGREGDVEEEMDLEVGDDELQIAAQIGMVPGAEEHKTALAAQIDADVRRERHLGRARQSAAAHPIETAGAGSSRAHQNDHEEGWGGVEAALDGEGSDKSGGGEHDMEEMDVEKGLSAGEEGSGGELRSSGVQAGFGGGDPDDDDDDEDDGDPHDDDDDEALRRQKDVVEQARAVYERAYARLRAMRRERRRERARAEAQEKRAEPPAAVVPLSTGNQPRPGMEQEQEDPQRKQEEEEGKKKKKQKQRHDQKTKARGAQDSNSDADSDVSPLSPRASPPSAPVAPESHANGRRRSARIASNTLVIHQPEPSPTARDVRDEPSAFYEWETAPGSAGVGNAQSEQGGEEAETAIGFGVPARKHEPAHRALRGRRGCCAECDPSFPAATSVTTDDWQENDLCGFSSGSGPQEEAEKAHSQERRVGFSGVGFSSVGFSNVQ